MVLKERPRVQIPPLSSPKIEPSNACRAEQKWGFWYMYWKPPTWTDHPSTRFAQDNTCCRYTLPGRKLLRRKIMELPSQERISCNNLYIPLAKAPSFTTGRAAFDLPDFNDFTSSSSSLTTLRTFDHLRRFDFISSRLVTESPAGLKSVPKHIIAYTHTHEVRTHPLRWVPEPWVEFYLHRHQHVPQSFPQRLPLLSIASGQQGMLHRYIQIQKRFARSVRFPCLLLPENVTAPDLIVIRLLRYPSYAQNSTGTSEKVILYRNL